MTAQQIHQARLVYRHFFRFMAARPEANWVAMPTQLAECGCYIVPIDESISDDAPLVQNVQSMTEDTFILRLVDARKRKS